MKFYFDTEFTGLHQDTTLISIGIVSEFGQSFYAELTDFDNSQVNDWIQEHVIDNLKFDRPVYYKFDTDDERGFYNVEMCDRSEEVAIKLLEWFNDILCMDDAIMCADCGHYDFVLFINLFKSIMDDEDSGNILPSFIVPYYDELCTRIYNSKALDHEVTDHEEAFDINREYVLEMLYSFILNQDAKFTEHVSMFLLANELYKKAQNGPKHNALHDAYVAACIDYFITISDGIYSYD